MAEAPVLGTPVAQVAPGGESMLNPPPVAEAPKAEGEAPKAEGEKPGEAPKAEAKPGEAPVPFDATKLVIPEGATLDDATKTQFAELATKAGLDQGNAQAMMDFGANLLKTQAETAGTAWAKTQETWVSEIKSMPEFAGEKLTETTKMISKVLDQYGSPEARKAFDLTGAGNNPAIFQTFAKMARALTEGTFTRANPAPGAPKSAAEAMYPSLSKEA